MRQLFCFALLTAVVAAAGCAGRRTVVVRSRHGPFRTTTVIRVNVPPPPVPRVTVVKVKSPSGHHVWVKGHYVCRGGSYVWVKGAWVRPPRHGAVWVPGHFERRDGHGVWVPGHWR